jgi:predicted helicase
MRSVLLKLGFREAVEGGMLCDYKVLIAAVRNDAVVDVAGLCTHTTRVGGKRVSAVVAAQLEALRQVIERMQEEDEERHAAAVNSVDADADADAAADAAAPPKIFTFHSSNDAALEFSQLVASELGGAPLHACAWHVFGTHKGVSQSVKVREALLRDEFAVCQHVAVVSNCKALMEGVDVPCVSGVAFIDPKKSVGDIAQAMGRALRHSPGKAMAYVIIPLLLKRPTAMRC